MRELIVLSFITLDGVMQAPGDPKRIRRRLQVRGWTVGYWDDFLDGVMVSKWQNHLTCCLEEDLRDFRRHTGLTRKAMTRLPESSTAPRKYVTSKTLRKLDWSNSMLVEGDTVQEIIKLKEQKGPELQVHAVVILFKRLEARLDRRVPLEDIPDYPRHRQAFFWRGTIPAGLKLVDSRTSTTGVIVATYRRAGLSNRVICHGNAN